MHHTEKSDEDVRSMIIFHQHIIYDVANTATRIAGWPSGGTILRCAVEGEGAARLAKSWLVCRQTDPDGGVAHRSVTWREIYKQIVPVIAPHRFDPRKWLLLYNIFLI